MRHYEREPQTIVLVEDSPDDERLAVRALRQSTVPFVLDVVRDGAEALTYFFGENGAVARGIVKGPMLVLLDLKLPKVGGLEVLKRLRADPATRYIPVVVLTLSDEERDVIESYRLGANSYIRKPVNYDHFMEIISQLSQYWFTLHTQVPIVPAENPVVVEPLP
jgi:two-component system response regulator